MIGNIAPIATILAWDYDEVGALWLSSEMPQNPGNNRLDVGLCIWLALEEILLLLVYPEFTWENHAFQPCENAGFFSRGVGSVLFLAA